jgi:zinc transport system substrate-binding protein
MTRFASLNSVLSVNLVAAVLLASAGCHKAKDPWDSVEGGQLKVLVSFPPIYCFTKAVTGKDAKVQTVLSATGPHEHQATSSDALLASGAKVFFINGLGLDESLAKIATGIKVVEVAEAIPEKKRLHMDEADHDHNKDKGKDHDKDKAKDHDHDKDKDKPKDHGHDHDHGEWNPHAWLGIEQAIIMVEQIRDTLKEADPAHKADYDKRAAAYVEKLKELQADGKKMLADKKNRKLIAMHDSLGYFCKSFDLELVDSIMPKPGVEADLKKLTELVEKCKKENVRILAVEPQYHTDKAKTLRDNLKSNNFDLAIIEIDPLETGPLQELGPDYYLKVMRKNLENLAKHMQ